MAKQEQKAPAQEEPAQDEQVTLVQHTVRLYHKADKSVIHELTIAATPEDFDKLGRILRDHVCLPVGLEIQVEAGEAAEDE